MKPACDLLNRAYVRYVIYASMRQQVMHNWFVNLVAFLLYDVTDYFLKAPHGNDYNFRLRFIIITAHILVCDLT